MNVGLLPSLGQSVSDVGLSGQGWRVSPLGFWVGYLISVLRRLIIFHFIIRSNVFQILAFVSGLVPKILSLFFIWFSSSFLSVVLDLRLSVIE